MKFLAISSAIGIFIAGISICVLWITAAYDKKFIGRQYGGCVQLFHSLLPGFGEMSTYLKNNRDAFPVLIIFGVACGVLWIITAMMSFKKAKYYLTFGIATTIIFICVFTPLVEIMRLGRPCLHLNQKYFNITTTIITNITNSSNVANTVNETINYNFTNDLPEYNNIDWRYKHEFDSYETFWVASMACFILAAYQIGSAITMVYMENEYKNTTLNQEIADTERALTIELPTEGRYEESNEIVRKANNAEPRKFAAPVDMIAISPIETQHLEIKEEIKEAAKDQKIIKIEVNTKSTFKSFHPPPKKGTASTLTSKVQTIPPVGSPVPDAGISNKEFSLNEF